LIISHRTLTASSMSESPDASRTESTDSLKPEEQLSQNPF